ncbi:MAG: nitrous oxide-stimulated promoter family protein [Acidobacteriota bacterium]
MSESAVRERPRRSREQRTLEAMVDVYCRGNHRDPSRCGECAELLAYSRQRLERCPYGAEKPTCAKCPIHCYRPERRAQVRAVMRYAGPRMTWRHPVFALRHLLDGRREAPPRPGKRKKPVGSGVGVPSPESPGDPR